MVLPALALVLAASPYADAKRDYADLDYEACVAKLADLRAVPARERAAAELLLGLCHFALGHEAQARARLEAALRRAPGLSAPANASPKEQAVIAEAREAAASAAAAKPRKTPKKPDKKPPAAVVAATRGEDTTAPAPEPERAAADAPPANAAPAPSPAPEKVSDAPVATALTPAPAVVTPPPAVVQPTPSRSSPVPWIAGGAAVAAAGVGVGFGLSARGLEAQGNAEPVQLEADRLRGQAQTNATVANVAFAVAGGAAIALVTWLVLR